ncbi:DUF421 domain-containing protein [Thermohalobacter berrensis]|uniref:YetF C-terminal domain-containing protein n=1 Tax=Thermohalobacter berrensis TaxID=99594 RepID=A0A419SUV9_9FIRM|nr:DUF421 domain-containing protein [Thermohalobacter berrensis]RKD29009.1 hypothetical protein BET03_06590 [Thermohalobacter berrensis]
MPAWANILLRSLGLFFVTLIFVRIIGKRNPAKITPFKFINYVVIGILVSLMAVNIITNLVFGFIALAVWSLLPIAIDYLSMKSKWIHEWVNGKETILIKNGKVMEENLGQARLTGEDLLRELRSKNIFNIADVEFAILEPTGDINVLLKSDKKPVTAHDLGKQVSPQSEPQTVILDGNILNEPLSNMGLNQNWLKTKLESMGVSLDNVFIGQVDSSGDLYVDLFDDSIQLPQPKVKELLYANIEKCQADLESFAIDTKDEKAKEMYSKNANKLKKVMKKIEPYLLR